jgi:hypothetical protein
MKEKGFAIPKPWDGRTAPPARLAFIPPYKTGTEPDGITTPMARRRRYPPAKPTPGFPIPACFTVEGADNPKEYDGSTGLRKLADFINVNQLGCCIALYHDQWHAAIGGAMTGRYFSTDDPTFYFGVHFTINKVYEAYLALPGKGRRSRANRNPGSMRM